MTAARTKPIGDRRKAAYEASAVDPYEKRLQSIRLKRTKVTLPAVGKAEEKRQ